LFARELGKLDPEQCLCVIYIPEVFPTQADLTGYVLWNDKYEIENPDKVTFLHYTPLRHQHPSHQLTMYTPTNKSVLYQAKQPFYLDPSNSNATPLPPPLRFP
jgi:hypothetical protein